MAYCTASIDVVRINVDQGGLGGDAAGPFEIEIGFAEVVFHGSGIPGVGDEGQLGVGGRKLKLGAEALDVGQIDAGLAGDDDFLPGSIVAGVPKGFDVVDGAEVVGAQVVVAGGGGSVVGFKRSRRRMALGCMRKSCRP